MIEIKKQTLSQMFSIYFDKRMLKILLLGAISGFPWVLIGSSLPWTIRYGSNISKNNSSNKDQLKDTAKEKDKTSVNVSTNNTFCDPLLRRESESDNSAQAIPQIKDITISKVVEKCHSSTWMGIIQLIKCDILLYTIISLIHVKYFSTPPTKLSVISWAELCSYYAWLYYLMWLCFRAKLLFQPIMKFIIWDIVLLVLVSPLS